MTGQYFWTKLSRSLGFDSIALVSSKDGYDIWFTKDYIPTYVLCVDFFLDNSRIDYSLRCTISRYIMWKNHEEMLEVAYQEFISRHFSRRLDSRYNHIFKGFSCFTCDYAKNIKICNNVESPEELLIQADLNYLSNKSL